MRRALASIVFVLLATPAFAVDWLPYSDSSAGFSVEFPGTPVLTTENIKQPDGTSVPATDYIVVVDDEAVFLVSVVDVRRYSAVDPAVAVDQCITGFVHGLPRLSDTPVQVDGQAGRVVSIQEGANVVTDEAFYVRGRIYQFGTLRPATVGDNVLTDIAHFMGSFHFAGGGTS